MSYGTSEALSRLRHGVVGTAIVLGIAACGSAGVSNGTATASSSGNGEGVAGNGTATLTWTPVTQNTDGTLLLDLAGYKVFYGPICNRHEHRYGAAGSEPNILCGCESLFRNLVFHRGRVHNERHARCRLQRRHQDHQLAVRTRLTHASEFRRGLGCGQAPLAYPASRRPIAAHRGVV